MVQKTSHRGVYSGNTLRASYSRYSRRYHNNACIVSRVHPDLLNKLIGKTAVEPQTSTSHNVAVDVPLSLNKQARWLLPSALIRQIDSDDIALSGLTVSLLERHKLKRPASCVSFHSNKGEVRRIQPRNGRYFSFNFSGLDGKSRRTLRREQREQEELQNRKKLRKMKVKRGKKVEVFTQQGGVRTKSTLGDSEVRYEVFYPSPAHSSISHNPKYIKQDVSIAPGDDGDRQLHGKPKKQHRGKQRNRMTLKDIDECDFPSYSGDYDQDLTEDAAADADFYHFYGHAQEEQKTTEGLLGLLIEKAERLQNSERKPRRLKKSGIKQCGHYEEDKSHVVYIQEELQAADSKDVNSPKSTPVAHLEAPFPSHFSRLLLPAEDVIAANLKECFGQHYLETSCLPRKFVLGITSHVRELLKKRGVQGSVADSTEDAVTFIILMDDGYYSEDLEVYKVLLSSKLVSGLQALQISPEQDLPRTTVISLISQAVDFIDGLVTDVQIQNSFPGFQPVSQAQHAARQLKKHLGSTESYVPSLQRQFQRLASETTSDITMPSLQEMLQEEHVFCDVCYEDVSPASSESTTATSLLKCRHPICDRCWSLHVHSRINQGFLRVTCPGYDCQEEANLGVLLSVVTLHTLEKLLQQQEDVRIGASPTEKWCPNESCGRVLRLQTSSGSKKCELQQDVVCACGAHVCFQCLLPAHWPASCRQAEDYRSNLATAVFPDRLAELDEDDQKERDALFKRRLKEVKPVMVEGKLCPKCNNFVFKDEGCAQMVCRCGQMFCWFCVKPGNAHYYRGPGCADEQREKKLTTTVVVRHLRVEDSEEKKKAEELSKALAGRRQRVSLMERAAEHRQLHCKTQKTNNKAISILAKTVAIAASKNDAVARHIIGVCSGISRQSAHNTKAASPRLISVPETVASFLKNTARCKQELHEVTEYSLVLLKDIPDSVFRQRVLRITENLGAFCSFIQSIFDVWNGNHSHGSLQEAVKAVTRLAEIQGWINSALAAHIATVKMIQGQGIN